MLHRSCMYMPSSTRILRMQLSQWALRHRFSARLQRRIRYQPPPLPGRAVLASRPRRHGKEPVPRQTETWKPRRPAFPVPQNRLQQVSRSSAPVGSAREIPFRYPLHCVRRDELVCT